MLTPTPDETWYCTWCLFELTHSPEVCAAERRWWAQFGGIRLALNPALGGGEAGA